MAALDVAEVAPMFLTYFAGIGDYDAVEKLRLYAQERAGPQAESLFNVARDRPATQSSTSRWSRLPSVAEEARGAVNGDIACEYGFHTDGESAPWWCVDLELVYLIRRIRLFNRRNHGARARTIVIATSCNLVDWASVYDGEGRAFTEGDADCIDLMFEPPKPMRFLRVSLQEEQVLHMREIEIYV